MKVRNAVATVERSMLFVPASRWSMLVKAAASEADVVCLDLEDSVPASEKERSRGNVVRALRELDFGGRLRMVRINGLKTSFALGDINEIVQGAGEYIDFVMVPKVGSPLDVAFVETLLAHLESRMRLSRTIGIEAQIESAAGFVNVNEIARGSRRLEALILGAGDFAASMGMPAAGIGTLDADDNLYPGHRYHSVMHAIVAAARANNLRCIDGPYSAHTDAVGFEQACRIARAMGFDGKQCIHPSQLPIANAVFSPTAEDISSAREIIDAYDRGAAEGRGAVSLDGRMVDEANVRMARVVLVRAERMKK